MRTAIFCSRVAFYFLVDCILSHLVMALVKLLSVGELVILRRSPCQQSGALCLIHRLLMLSLSTGETSCFRRLDLQLFPSFQ